MGVECTHDWHYDITGLKSNKDLSLVQRECVDCDRQERALISIIDSDFEVYGED